MLLCHFLALKKSYVDVFNPSGAPSKPIEPIMAPTVPVPSIPHSGYFVPGAVPAVTEGQTQQLDVSIFWEIRQEQFLLSITVEDISVVGWGGI